MHKIFFIRHGLSELNIKYLFCGHTDSPLSDIGREEASIAGQRFLEDDHTKNIKFAAIYSSPLSRARETAELFVKGANITEPPIKFEPLLIERNFGSLEQTRYSKEISASLLNDNLPEGVEKWDDVVKRANQILENLEAINGDVLLVGHGSIGRALKKAINDKYAKNLDWEQHIPNSELIQLL